MKGDRKKMKKLFSLIISAVLVLGAASAVFAAEEPNPALLEPEMSLVITQDCIGYQDGKALEEVYVLSGSEVTFRVGDNVPESSDVQWLAQFPTGTAFTDYQRIEGGRAITMKVPSDLLVAAFAEGIPPYEGTPAEEPAPVEEEVPAGDLPFTDVKNSDWFHDAVKEMYEKGYMGGVSDNKYEPQSEGKRSEIVTVLYRIDGSPKMSGDLKFSDITKGTELADAAIWASECGIASGYPDGTFKPDQSVSRQELAIFIYKYAQYKGLDTSVKGLCR